MEANKVVDTLATRLGNRIAFLEKECSMLLVQNSELKAENEGLKATLKEKEEKKDDTTNNKR